MPTTFAPGPLVEADRLVFRLPDPERHLHAVAVHQELTRPRDGLRADWVDGVWEASLPRPDREPGGALRLEYAFVVTGDDGQGFVTDPGNPLVAPGAFGDKSVVELPGYARPGWVDAPLGPEAEGTESRLDLPLPRFDTALPCRLWEPPGATADQPLPLLVVHDGPEFADLAELPRLLAHMVAAGRIPPLRAALLGPPPGRRDEAYSAAARYADGLVFTGLGWLSRTAPQPEGCRPVLLGASLGAVAALHAAHRHPGSLGGLLLQSGSFFRLRTDRHERGFAHFDRISRFVGEVLRARRATDPLPIAMTCGTVEENLANNRVMAAALTEAGHDVALTEVRDGHTFTAWRDALDPVLPDLLARAVGWPSVAGSSSTPDEEEVARP